MNGRERILTAIRHEVPDRIPISVISIDDPKPIAEHLGIAPEQVFDRLGIDGWSVAAWTYTGPLLTSPDGLSRNDWGTSAWDEYGAGHAYPLADADRADAIDRYPWPDASRYNFAETADHVRRAGTRYALRGPYWLPVFCRACSLFGMEELMVKMLTTPTVVDAALHRITDHAAAYCEHLLSACGDALPIFCLGDDFATQRGLMIAPALWRRFLKAHYARLFAIGKRHGKPIWFHSCGDITSILPDLIDIGMDVWETVQLHALPLSARELKREYGRHITFFGGVNTQRLPFVKPDEVQREVRQCIQELGEGGGYICGPDHHIKPDVPPDNTLALFDTALGFRAAGYTSLHA